MEYITKLPDWDNKKILIIRLDRLGDLIVSTPAMKSIRNTFPNAKIDLLGSSLNKALFKHCNYINNTFCYDKKNILDIIKLFIKLRKEKYDIIINFTPNSRSANFFVKNLNVPIRMSFSEPKEKNKKIFTHLPPTNYEGHLLKLYQENCKNMGFTIPPLNPIIEIPLTTFEKINAEFPRNPDKMRIIISIGNILRPHKRWKIEYYGKVIEYLHKKYNLEDKKLDIIVMTGKSDLALIQEFGNLSKDYYTLYIGTDIAESAALIENSDLFICTSSGPSHIAASTSCPILSLITQYMYDCWRPLRENDECIVNDNIHDIKIEEVIEKTENYIQNWQAK